MIVLYWMSVSNISWLYLCQVADMLQLLSLKLDRIKMLGGGDFIALVFQFIS